MALSPSTMGSVPCGYLPRRSSPPNQPPKWNGIQATPLPTRSVTSALTLALELFSAPVTQTQPPSLMPRVGGVGRVDLDEHVLLQLGEPLVGAGLLAAAFVFDQPAGGEDERELLGDAFVDRRLLHREADVRQPELLGVGQRRVFRDQIDARRVDRLAVHRDRVGQVPRDVRALPLP